MRPIEEIRDCVSRQFYDPKSMAALVEAIDELARLREVNAELEDALEICARSLQRLRPWIQFTSSPSGGENDAVANFDFALRKTTSALSKAGAK